MDAAPALLFLLCGLGVSLEADWELQGSPVAPTEDAVDYKDPCKAGTVTPLNPRVNDLFRNVKKAI